MCAVAVSSLGPVIVLGLKLISQGGFSATSQPRQPHVLHSSVQLDAEEELLN